MALARAIGLPVAAPKQSRDQQEPLGYLGQPSAFTAGAGRDRA